MNTAIYSLYIRYCYLHYTQLWSQPTEDTTFHTARLPTRRKADISFYICEIQLSTLSRVSKRVTYVVWSRYSCLQYLY